MGGANLNPRMASVKAWAILCWHQGLRTAAFNDCAGVQAIRAHLREAAHPFDPLNPANGFKGKDRDESPAVREII